MVGKGKFLGAMQYIYICECEWGQVFADSLCCGVCGEWRDGLIEGVRTRSVTKARREFAMRWSRWLLFPLAKKYPSSHSRSFYASFWACVK